MKVFKCHLKMGKDEGLRQRVAESRGVVAESSDANGGVAGTRDMQNRRTFTLCRSCEDEDDQPVCLSCLRRLRHQAHKELYAYKQVIVKEKVKELNLHEICAVCLEEFKTKDELGICPCKHAFHRKCLIKWLEVRKVCPLCNTPVLQNNPEQGGLGPTDNLV
uniref:Ring finger protein 24 n=1 Tax=Callorhinchus milii TaxID=7868 RepID=A0A4W3IJQ4_CALMI